LDKREYQYVGLDLGKRYKEYFTPASIPFIRKLITTKSWWDTVDAIASHMVGAIVFNYPEMVTIMDEWIDHENMWIRRTAILHQLNFKDRTDPKRLFDYCKKQMNESDFFIRKAIGWALRQYSYVDASAVIQFVKTYESELSTSSKSEALKALKRKGKI
jgi:3-methyladenine DNA glycosylase AlkD